MPMGLTKKKFHYFKILIALDARYFYFYFVIQVEHVVFENSLSISKHVFVATAQNVVACISAKSGEIVWRKIISEADGKVSLSLNIISTL